MKETIILLIAALFVKAGIAQQQVDTGSHPVIGKPCPDFVLQNIQYFNKKTAANADFKDKWLVLDFWNRFCGACVASFPSVNKKSIEFKDQLQYMMVGIQDKDNQIQPMYAKFREREHLTMPCAFDSVTAKRWDISAGPQLILIDPQGVVRAITTSLSEDDLKGFLSGHPPFIPNEENDRRPEFNPSIPFLVHGNGGQESTFFYRSVFSEYDPAVVKQYFPASIAEDSVSGKFQVIGLTLTHLFNYAWFGKIWPDSGFYTYPIAEVKDTTLFKYKATVHKGYSFSYSLILPAGMAAREKRMKIMQHDLENAFNMTARIEEREFPAWKLIATEEAKKKLKTKGGTPFMKAIVPKVEYNWQNRPFSDFFAFIHNYGDDIIDATGITGNIDIHINCQLLDFDEIKKELYKKGLELIPVQRIRKVLVIRDLPADRL